MRPAARLLLVLCLLASTAQGVIARTHVHAAAGVTAAVGAMPLAQAAVRADPLCLLCEIAGHTPAVAPPAAAAAALPVSLAPVVPAFVSTFASGSPASHHWRGRAPPRPNA